MKESDVLIPEETTEVKLAMRIAELEAENRLNYLNSVAGQKKVIELESQLDAVLNTEVDWHDGPLKVKDLGAVQAAINGEDDG